MGQQVVTLTPGQTYVIPSNATIDSWLTTGDATLSSSCDNLGTEDEYCCIGFRFADSEADPDGALESLTLLSIEVGGTVYDMENLDLDGNTSPTDTANAINAITSPVFHVFGIIVDVLAQRTEWGLSAQVPCSMVDTVKFRVTGTGFGEEGAYLIPFAVDPCSCILPATGDSTATHCEEL